MFLNLQAWHFSTCWSNHAKGFSLVFHNEIQEFVDYFSSDSPFTSLNDLNRDISVMSETSYQLDYTSLSANNFNFLTSLVNLDVQITDFTGKFPSFILSLPNFRKSKSYIH